jgi:hypothetical protein
MDGSIVSATIVPFALVQPRFMSAAADATSVPDIYWLEAPAILSQAILSAFIQWSHSAEPHMLVRVSAHSFLCSKMANAVTSMQA